MFQVLKYGMYLKKNDILLLVYLQFNNSNVSLVYFS